MIFEVFKDELKQEKGHTLSKKNDDNIYLGLFKLNELPEIVERFNIQIKRIEELINWSLSSADHHQKFDIIHVDYLKLKHLKTEEHLVVAYKDSNNLYFFAEEHLLDELNNFYKTEKHPRYNLDKLLFLFFKKMTSEYSECLNTLEEKIVNLEKDMLEFKEHNYLKSIMLIRRVLINFNNNIEKNHDLLEDMLLDENSLICDEGKLELSSIMRKFDRLLSRTMLLKELVSQVKDTYQSQEDLKLNRTMKYFTVVTSIFLPLTVITGWYGMNLKMPEFGLDYGYPIVIALSLTVVFGSVIYFKKKKWF